MSFKYEHYRKTVNNYLSAGYKVSSFRDHLNSEPAKKALILRHDIDLSLEAALKMGRADAELGITSTFFLRMHATNYNLLAFPGLKLVEKLIELNHEIGLHYEPGVGVYLDPARALDISLATKTYLEKLFNIKIEGMSTHEPARANDEDLVSKVFQYGGLKYHAYEPRFTTEMKYLSDSGGRWREGCFSTWVDKVPRLQVLVHPFWWYDSTSLENY